MAVKTNTTTSRYDLDPLFLDPITKSLKELGYLYDQGYQPYGGPRIQDFNQDQQDYFTGIRGLQGQGMDEINAAMGRLADASSYQPQKFTDVAQDYMNPYLENVLDRQQKRMFRSDDIARKGRDARASAAGAFGGDRQAIQESESQKNLQDRMADQEATALSNAYQTGAKIFSGDANRALQNQKNLIATQQGIGRLAGQGQALTGEQLRMLGGAGSAQQQMNQAGLDLAYQDFENQRRYPYEQLNYFMGGLQGFPNSMIPSSTTGTTTSPTMGNMGRMAGLGVNALGMWGMGGGFDGGFSMNNLFGQQSPMWGA